MKILVTDGEERAALAATRSLGRSAEVHVAASSAASLAGVSRSAAGRRFEEARQAKLGKQNGKKGKRRGR